MKNTRPTSALAGDSKADADGFNLNAPESPTGASLCLEQYARQEAQFAEWIRSYYQSAFTLHCLRLQVGNKKFNTWLDGNLRPDQIDLVRTMLDQLHNTAKGKAILETCTNPDNFIFPE